MFSDAGHSQEAVLSADTVNSGEHGLRELGNSFSLGLLFQNNFLAESTLSRASLLTPSLQELTLQDGQLTEVGGHQVPL